MFDFECEWEELMELSHVESRKALEWLVVHGIDLEDCDCGDGIGLEDVDLDGDFRLYVDGYWADFSPVIVFEDGRVARWYRSGACG